jgi:hypothetical protein
LLPLEANFRRFRNQNRFREYQTKKERGMKLVLIAVILVSAAFARVGCFETRWARQEAREARQWAREETREARREAVQYRQEARRYAMEAEREARREAQRYRNELRRELRDNLRPDRSDSTGMRRVF